MVGACPKPLLEGELEFLAERLQVDPTSPSGLRWKVKVAQCITVGQVAGSKGARGYWKSNWYFKGQKRNRSCHSLVLELSGKPLPGEGYSADHVDQDRSNNSLSNLRWVSCSQQAYNRKGWSSTGFKYASKGKSSYYFQFWMPNKSKLIKRRGFATAEAAHAAAVRMREELGLDGSSLPRGSGRQ